MAKVSPNAFVPDTVVVRHYYKQHVLYIDIHIHIYNMQYTQMCKNKWIR